MGGTLVQSPRVQQDGYGRQDEADGISDPRTTPRADWFWYSAGSLMKAKMTQATKVSSTARQPRHGGHVAVISRAGPGSGHLDSVGEAAMGKAVAAMA